MASAPLQAVDYTFDDEAQDESCIIEGELPLVPPGKYQAVFDTWETVALFGGRAKKLVLHFTILDPGYMGTSLPKYYNIRQLVGKPRKRGQFKVGRKSDFLRDYCDLHGTPSRKDRVSICRFGGKPYTITVRTVTKTSTQRDIHEALHYSVVDHIGRAKG